MGNNYDNLVEEINNLIETLKKETPGSENYETDTKRLGELWKMAIDWKELELKETTQKSDEALKMREIITQEADIHQKEEGSKRETRREYIKTIMLIAGTILAEAVTQCIEDKALIPQKAWAFAQGIFRRV